MFYKPYDDEYRKTLSTNHVNTYRSHILFKWLYEFKFTDYPTAFKLVGLDKSKGGYRFIRKLIEKEYLVQFFNVQMGNKVNLITLTNLGVRYMRANGLIYEDEPYLRLKRLKSKSNMYHHLGVQKAVMQQLGSIYNFYDGDFETHIDWELKKGEIRPDGFIELKPVMDDEVGAKIAIEFERTSKSRKRIYYLLRQHDINMKKGLYSTVVYCFDDPAIRAIYVDLYEDDWPSYGKNKQTHRIVDLVRKHEPDHYFDFNFIMLKD